MSSAAKILISMIKKNILNFLLKMSLMLIFVAASYPQFSIENESDVNFCCSKVLLS